MDTGLSLETLRTLPHRFEKSSYYWYAISANPTKIRGARLLSTAFSLVGNAMDYQRQPQNKLSSRTAHALRLAIKARTQNYDHQQTATASSARQITGLSITDIYPEASIKLPVAYRPGWQGRDLRLMKLAYLAATH